MARPSLGDIFGVQDDRPPLSAFFGASDFSDVTGGAMSTAPLAEEDLLRKKRAQMAQARQIAAAQGLAGPAPSQSAGGRAVALGDRFVSAAAEGLVSIPELAAKILPDSNASAMLPSQDTEREVPGDPYPTIGKPGGFLDLHAQREDIRQQAAAARERLLGSQGDPGVIAAADTLAEAGGMAIPFGEGAGAAKALDSAQPLVHAAEALSPEAAAEAAYLARRAKVMPEIPGAGPAPITGAMVRESLRPEADILGIGAHPDAVSQDVALGLRARPQDAADAAELSRVSQGLDEHAAPSLPREAPPSLAEIFGNPENPAVFTTNAAFHPGADLPQNAQIGADLPRAPFSSPLEAPPAGPSLLREAVTERGTRIGFDYEVRDAGDLITSHDFDANARSSAKVAGILGRYADLVEGLGHPHQVGLFGAAEIPTRMELLKAAASQVENQGNLFAMAERPPLTATADAELAGRTIPPPARPVVADGMFAGQAEPSPILRPEQPIPPPAGIRRPPAPPEASLPGMEPPPDADATLRNLLTHEELPLDTPYTGTKNAITEGERIARGLPEVEALARKSTGDTWAEARQTFEADPEAPRLLAARIAEKPRTLTAVENDLLLHDRMKMSLGHRDALAGEAAALDAGDHEAAAMAKMRRQSIEQAMDVNDTALKRAGAEWSAGGQARQKLISEDYSPLYLRQRLTVAAREAGVAPAQGAAEKLDQLSQQLAEAQAQLAGYEERLSQVHGERAVAAAQKDVAAADRAGVRRAARGNLDAEYQDLAAKLEAKARKNQSTVNMSGGLDPETVGIIGKMAKNRVQAGARGLGDVVDGIFQTIRPHIEGLEPSEVRDAISGYGVVRQQATHSEAIAELAKIRQQGRLVSKLEALQETGALPAPRPRAKPAAEVAALQEKLRQVTRDLDANPLRTDAQRLVAMKTRLEKRITDAERGLAPRAARAPLPDTPETAALRKRLAQVMDEHGLAPDPEAQRLAALKTRLTTRAAELEKHIAEGYIPKKVRRPVALDSDAIALQGKVNGLKRQADLIIRKQELAGRSGAEKALDMTAGWGRFLKLTGVSTVQKLGAAAAERALVFRPLEEFLGAGISRLPVVKHFAREASIEGGGSLSAVAKSYAAFFGKAAREEMVAHLAGREGPMELALGKPHLGGETPEWMNYPGHLHAFLKSPAKIAGYEYALEKQSAHYLRLGQAEKLADPLVIEQMKARAWEHANRDIFMGDNAAVNAFRRAFAHQEGDSLAARAGKTAANVLMPIVKVPTNYALEATDYLAGLPKAAGYMAGTIRAGKKALAGESASLAEVVHAGLEALPEGRADLILRQLKKGSLGAGLIALGATGAVRVGGYYDGPRREGDLHPGQIEVAGHVVPHMILHHPALEALQVGGAIYRAKTLAGGLGTAAKGLAEVVPFVETPVSMARDLWGREPMKAVGNFERGMTIPPDAQRLARVLDQKHPTTPGKKILQELGWEDIEAKKRKTRGPFLRQLVGQEEMGIPGLRDNVR